MNAISASQHLIGQGIEDRYDAQSIDREKIDATAQEFEGIFISMLVKEMRNTLGEGGLFGGESTDSLGGMFDLFIGQHLAESQPLGIANIWLQQYQSNHVPSETGTQMDATA